MGWPTNFKIQNGFFVPYPGTVTVLGLRLYLLPNSAATALSLAPINYDAGHTDRTGCCSTNPPGARQ